MATRMQTTITCKQCGKEFSAEADFNVWHGFEAGKEKIECVRIEKVECPHCGAEN